MTASVRRSTMTAAVALLATACVAVNGVCSPTFEPIAADVSGAMLPARADELPIECRGLPFARCDVGSAIQMVSDAGLDPASAQRVVVSCVGRCTARGGETRMDAVLVDGTTRLLANGGYGEFRQSC